MKNRSREARRTSSCKNKSSRALHLDSLNWDKARARSHTGTSKCMQRSQSPGKKTLSRWQMRHWLSQTWPGSSQVWEECILSSDATDKNILSPSEAQTLKVPAINSYFSSWEFPLVRLAVLRPGLGQEGKGDDSWWRSAYIYLYLHICMLLITYFIFSLLTPFTTVQRLHQAVCFLWLGPENQYNITMN